ncbi:MAG: response regulator, partial [Nitrospira sp.]|nr:response regulator [Nitrospira sp.]
MLPLVYEFSDKIRFFDTILKSEDHRLFVPTQVQFPAGAQIPLEIHIAGDPQPIKTQAKEVGTRRGRGSGPAEPGVWVQIDDANLAAIRSYLEFSDGDGQYLTVRNTPRHKYGLFVEVEKPITRSSRTRDISEGGMCLDGVIPVSVGQTVRVLIHFEAEVIGVFGRVAWCNTENMLTGIEFRFQDPKTRSRVFQHVSQLGEWSTASPGPLRTLLVVDDDLATIKALSFALASHGYDVCAANSGPETLSIARSKHPDVILMDFNLTAFNGLEVCRALARDTETGGIPIVLTTAGDDTRLKSLLDSTGVLAAVPKPYNLEALSDLLEKIHVQNRALSPMSSKSMLAKGSPKQTDVETVLERCRYESATLNCETFLRNVSGTDAFLISYASEPEGTRAQLRVQGQNYIHHSIDVEVIERIAWGLRPNASTLPIPGMRVRF